MFAVLLFIISSAILASSPSSTATAKSIHLSGPHHHHHHHALTPQELAIHEKLFMDIANPPTNISCWIQNKNEEPTLSAPIFTYCLYDSSAYPEVLLGGIVNIKEKSADDKEMAKLLEPYERKKTGTAGSLICIQVAVRVVDKTESNLWCLCRRSACNPPGTLGNLFKVNRNFLKEEL